MSIEQPGSNNGLPIELVTYLAATDAIDDKLNGFLEYVKTNIKDVNRVNELMSYLALAFPLHVLRKHKHIDLQSKGVPLLASAFENSTQWIRGSLGATADCAVAWEQPLPLNLAGYDPRYGDQAGTLWRHAFTKACESAQKASPIKFNDPKLLSDYNSAKAAIYGDFHVPTTRYDLLLVDFSWLPELAYLGHLEPLDQHLPGMDQHFFEKLNPTMGPQEAKWWGSILGQLSKGGHRHHYALPIFVNLHGQLRAKDAAKSALEANDFKTGAIQNAHSACCVYELYAHFAYRSASPIVVRRNESDNYELTRLSFTDTEAKEALADYLARLILVWEGGDGITHDLVRFSIDHRREVGFLAAGAPFTFDVCFNSELVTDVGIRSKYTFAAPYAQSGKYGTQFLSSIGGYGLAISRQAENLKRAVDVAWRLYENSQLVDEYARLAAVPIVSSTSPDSFMRYHCRPQIPFWSHVEELISFAIDELFVALSKGATLGTFAQMRKSIIEQFAIKDSPARLVLRQLQRRILVSFTNNGWNTSAINLEDDEK